MRSGRRRCLYSLSFIWKNSRLSSRLLRSKKVQKKAPEISLIMMRPVRGSCFQAEIMWLVKQCLKMLDDLFPMSEKPISVEDGEEGCVLTTTSTATTNEDDDDDIQNKTEYLAGIEYMKSFYMKSTISALRTLK